MAIYKAALKKILSYIKNISLLNTGLENKLLNAHETLLEHSCHKRVLQQRDFVLLNGHWAHSILMMVYYEEV